MKNKIFEIPKYPRYKLAVTKSFLFLKNENIREFPFDIFKIIDKNNWGVASYSYLASTNNTTVEKISELFNSNDGYTYNDGSKYSIAYNDCINSWQRVRFTLLHEIAHIYLEHFEMLNYIKHEYGCVDKHFIDLTEKEANTFARNALAPSVVWDMINIKDIEYGMILFGLSEKGTKTREKLVGFDKSQLSLEEIKIQKIYFSNFLDRHIRRKTCEICDSLTSTKYGKYCKTCGEALTPYFLQNHCDNELCHKVLPTHERACTKCGNESFYSMLGLLD